GVENGLDEEGGRDGGVARAGDRGAREKELDDVAAAGRNDVVEADGGEVSAPDAPERKRNAGVGGAQAVEVGARAQRQVQAEEDEPEQEHRPVDRRQFGE